MPAITNQDFSLTEQYLLSIANQGAFDKEILNRLRAILNVCMPLTPEGEAGVLIRDEIRKGQSFIAKHGNAIAKGYILENIGARFLDYVEEIYSCDPERMIARARSEKGVPAGFIKIIEGCVSVYEGMEDRGRLVELYRLAIEICDISAFAMLG